MVAKKKSTTTAKRTTSQTFTGAKMSKQKADIEDVSRLDKNIEDVLQKISKISIEVDEFNIAKEQISKMHNALINAVVKDDFVSQMVVFEKKLFFEYQMPLTNPAFKGVVWALTKFGAKIPKNTSSAHLTKNRFFL